MPKIGLPAPFKKSVSRGSRQFFSLEEASEKNLIARQHIPPLVHLSGTNEEREKMAKTTSKRTANRPASRTAGATGQLGTQSSMGLVSDTANEQTTGAPATSTKAALTTSAIEALKLDHRNVEKLFKEYESSDDDDRKNELVRQICSELIIHTKLEEEIFYRACREAIEEEDLMREAQVEHDSAKVLIADLMQGDADDPYRDAKVSVLAEQIKHHVGEEEKPDEGIFAKAQAHGIVDDNLARRLRERKGELQRRAAEQRPTRAVSIQLSALENDMARYSNDRDRDDRGRFMSDDDDYRRGGNGGSGRDRDDRGRFMSDDRDDRGNGRGGWFGDSEGHSRAARSRFDDEDRRGGSRGGRDDDDDGRGHGRGGWFGDSEGHSQAARSRFDDDDRRGGSPGRGRDDDDDGRGRGHGRGGWFGDSEGHSRAARSRFDDDDRRSGRGRGDDDDGRGHGRGGWFGDSEGHSRAARSRLDDDRRSSGSRGRDDDDGRGHGRGGWFGDSEGHARAARSRFDDDRRSSGSRGREDDDRGRGGWFGDSRGHAEASRRGWENRR